MGWAGKNLSEGLRKEIAESLFTVKNIDGVWLNGLCPFHGDENPSFGYNLEADVFHCLSGCTKDGDLVDLFCRVNGYEQKEGFIKFKEQYGSNTATAPPPKKQTPQKTEAESSQDLAAIMTQMAEAYESFPPLPDTWTDRLTVLCGWSREVISALGLRMQTKYRDKHSGQLKPVRDGWGRIVIPIYYEGGTLGNLRLYLPDGNPKILSWAGGLGKNKLFPLPETGQEQQGLILLCEGEKDTMCARSQGYEAYTQTSKRMKWPADQLKHFSNRDVMICYDADEPGAKYAAAAASELAKVANSVKILNWPPYMLDENGKLPKKSGQDLTDFFVKHGKTVQDFEDLFPLAEAIAATEKSSRDTVFQFFGESLQGRLTFQPLRLAERIMQDVSILSDPKTGLLYRWNSKMWEVYEEDNVKKIAIDHLEYESNTTRVNDACNHVKILSTIPYGREVNDKTTLACLKNGMLNLDTYEITPHRREHYSTIMLNVDFDPKRPQKCDRWLQYLDETVQTPAAIKQVQEFFGYCLTRETRYEKCLITMGDGADGKSTAQKILRAMCGEENCTSVSFDGLEDQFQRAGLYGKLVNLSSEVGGKAMDSEFFKKIVSGDPINAAFKHKDSFDFKPYAKLIFSVNKMPKIIDNTDGFFRRLLIVHFKRQFLEGDPARDPHLEEKLMSELSGIFAWSLAGLARLREQGGFTQCNEALNLLADYRRLNNPVYAFVEDSCEVGDEKVHTVPKESLYEHYKKYCLANGYKSVHRENFWREIRVVVKNIKNFRPRVDGERQNWYKGISLKLAVE